MILEQHEINLSKKKSAWDNSMKKENETPYMITLTHLKC